jgi:phosphotransferase system enzyme I (PtsI)
MIKGIPASDGIAIGSAYVLNETTIDFDELSALDLQDELNRFTESVEKGIARLEALKDKTIASIGEHEAEVFEAHKQLLIDPVTTKEIVDLIDLGHSSEYSISQVFDKYITMFQGLDNAYMRERALDLKDIKQNQLMILTGVEENKTIPQNSIIVTYDLTPSETVNLDRKHTIGFVTEIGGETSHSAIIARTMGIPAVVGTGAQSIQNGDQLIIDGNQGLVYVNPTKEILEDYISKQTSLDEEKKALQSLLELESKTLCGVDIEVSCNIAGVGDLPYLHEVKPDGIGLFRSEFLYMNRTSLPSEEEQFHAYKEVLESLSPRPVTIRTMDIGGDKQLDYLDIPEELNPFLGFRAIRICLEDLKMFKAQLRALVRASEYGHLRIMFPMVSCLEELLEIKRIYQSVYDELDSTSKIEIGIMIEVPTAAMTANDLADEVDFFSIGTNDLIQYSTAVDRMNAKIADLYSPYHPGVLRMINHVISEGTKAGIEVGMCGNVAGMKDFIPLLLDMGLREFSMSPDMILKAKQVIRQHRIDPKRVDTLIQLKLKEDIKKGLSSYA